MDALVAANVKGPYLFWMPFRSGASVLSGCVVAVLASVVFSACDRQAPEDLAVAEAPIIGGKLDTTHRGIVSLLKQAQGGYYPACSGTLLTQNLVLTAHHCVAGLNSADGESVECGKTQFKATEKGSTMLVSVEANVGAEGLDPFRVATVWVPDGAADVCGRDVALLLLSGSGIPASVATPIEPALAKELAPDEVFAAIGYGLQDPNDMTGETAGHRMGVSDAKVFCEGTACGTALVKDGEFIADSPVCSGDSGGPALNKDGRVSGVTSRGDQKCTVGIYSSVYAWRDFIIEKTLAAAQSGNYDPPAWAGGSDPTVPNGGSSGVGGSSSTGGSRSGSAGSGGNPGSVPLPSAGTGPVNIGGSTSASGGNGTSSPTIDPLGLACNGNCPGSYKCWAASGTPPGICVPECSASDTTCPSDFSCNLELGACIKPTTETHQSSGCSVATPGAGDQRGGQWLSLGLGLLGFALGSRRRPRARAR